MRGGLTRYRFRFVIGIGIGAPDPQKALKQPKLGRTNHDIPSIGGLMEMRAPATRATLLTPFKDKRPLPSISRKSVWDELVVWPAKGGADPCRSAHAA